ncbi:MAG: ABC transporter substrate-binding protein [Euryarchaeota archaeon]|nr:ABC transporter substrate-binding protein [Euryarchaeota archaeon]
MKPGIFAVLVLMLTVTLSPPACALATGDIDEDRIVSEAELTALILAYLDASPGDSSNIGLSDLRSASHIHAYYPRTIPDSNGDEVTIYTPVRRIVALTSDCAEVIRSLGATDEVVGVSTGIAEDDFFSEFEEVQTVGKWNSPDCEVLLALDPDVVLAYGKWPGKDKLEAKLGGTDIAVIRLNLYIPENMTDDVRKLGIVLEQEGNARELIDFYQHHTDLISERVENIPTEDRQSIYLECYSDFKTVSSGSGGDSMCVMAGGRNIASGLIGAYPKIDSEWVIAQNPDVLVRAASASYDNTSEPEALMRDIMSRPGWADMDAVKGRRVHLLTSDIYTGPRYIIGVTYMAKWLYPDTFEDLDPSNIHREYLERFQDMGILDNIFVYP